MPLDQNPTDELVNDAELGLWIGISARTVRDLADKGVFDRPERNRYPLRACILAYTARLREQAAGRGGDDVADLTAERARLAKVQADAQEMKNAALRAELLPRADVTAAVQSAFARTRARLLALPAKLAPVVAGLTTAQAKDRIEDGVHEALAELAATQVVAVAAEHVADLLDGDGGGDGAGGPGLVSDPRAAAEADGQPVGRRGKAPVARGKRRAR